MPARDTVLTGRFHLIWNGEPRWFLVQGDGASIELLRDERLLERYGGEIEQNGKLVRVTGVVVSESPRRIRASSIRPVEEAQ